MMKGLAVLAVLLAGCDLYFGGDDEPCAYPAGGGGGAPMYEVRDPATGQCQYVGGGWQCPDACGPCAYDTAALSIADWGMCYGTCSGLDEASCMTATGCYAAYLEPAYGDAREFWGCWNTAPSGPVRGQCDNLDAYSCSRHDDCIAVYTTDAKSAQTRFDYCAAESVTYCVSDGDCGGDAFCDTTVCYPSPTCTPCDTCGACPDSNTCYGVCIPKDPHACDVIDCGAGYHCEEQCDASSPNMYCGPVCVADATCAAVDCAPGYTCAEVCTAGTNGQLVCSPTCVPSSHDPGSCTGTLQCLMPAPACPAGTTPGIKNGCYTGYCIPNTACGPNDPGECYGAVACDALPPSCPTGTVPGVTNGCWSGYCIPQAACPTAACESLSSESACLARMDCLPIYDGTQCTCDPNGCTCQVLTYARCETL